MNEKMIEELGTILEYLRIGIEKGGQFVGDQAPLVVREAIAYGRAYETAWLAIGLLLLLQGLIGFKKRWSDVKFSDSSYQLFDTPADCLMFWMAMPRTVLMIGGAITFAAKWDNVLMAWFAPRIYLMQWIAELIQQTRVQQ